MENLSSILFLIPLGLVITHVWIATRQKNIMHEIKHVLWSLFFILLFISNQLARMY